MAYEIVCCVRACELRDMKQDDAKGSRTPQAGQNLEMRALLRCA